MLSKIIFLEQEKQTAFRDNVPTLYHMGAFEAKNCGKLETIFHNHGLKKQTKKHCFNSFI